VFVPHVDRMQDKPLIHEYLVPDPAHDFLQII
jgi:hypothetical protein